ncbi:hypothetical protein [Azospirillum canadense]|uniref:hypothetical protein n=1 Tax=Azospirillum canadense TaxID=403962 RepID=UPI0022261763|nr:hypothetical protein [Azospirillum canadense]MCW2241638.1 hypothetical protein [Azospirillum canadense]
MKSPAPYIGRGPSADADAGGALVPDAGFTAQSLIVLGARILTLYDMRTIPKYRPRWPSFLAPFGVAGLLALGLWANILHGSQRDREQTRHEAEVTAANLARAFDEHVVRTVQHIDAVLLHLRLEYQRNPERFNDRQGDVFWNTYGAEFMQVGIIDRDGRLLYSNLTRGTG